MPEELLTVIVPAIAGLAGTLVGLWMGQRRWAAEFRLKKRKAFDALRHKAYQQLWTTLENAHVAIRTGRPEPAQIKALDREINTFRLYNSVYLEPEDLTLSNRYFNSVIELAGIIAKSGSEELAERFENTNAFTESEVREIEGLAEANRKAEQMRNALVERVRAILLETSYAVTPASD